MSAQPEAEKIEGYEGTDLIVIFGVLVLAIGCGDLQNGGEDVPSVAEAERGSR